MRHIRDRDVTHRPARRSPQDAAGCRRIAASQPAITRYEPVFGETIRFQGVRAVGNNRHAAFDFRRGSDCSGARRARSVADAAAQGFHRRKPGPAGDRQAANSAILPGSRCDAPTAACDDWRGRMSSYVGNWPIASFRGRAAIRSLLVRSGHPMRGNAGRSVANDRAQKSALLLFRAAL
jgi:hypothetical protein